MRKISLQPRGADTINIIKFFNPTSLPFYDDFSSDKRAPREVSSFITNQYYLNGNCVEYRNLKRGRHRFSTKPTFQYYFDVTKPPLYVDSIANFTMAITTFNDSPSCTVSSFDLFYPMSTRRFFSSSGVETFKEDIFDTILEVAYVQEVTLKNLLWIDRDAYLNGHLAHMPYSKGVATLDGLSEFGRPYDSLTANAYGKADFLTSFPIDISTFSDADSMYLSFMIEPQGYGDWPDREDSIVVEFKDDNQKWHQVYRKFGLTRAMLIDTIQFEHVLIKIPLKIVPSDPNYYHTDFQFRFKNFATISGNNDHWHIDYVRLDTGRNAQDTTIRDATFVYDLSTVLKNHTLLPSKQYRGHIDLLDSVTAINRNILPAVIFSTYNYSCKNMNTNTTYGANSGIPYSAEWIAKLQVSTSNNFNYPTSIPDSTYITSKLFLDQSDDNVLNDTASHTQFFFNEMAYDDGSAETAYGIQGLGIKKMAFRYIIPNKDTLAAIKVLFSNIDIPVQSLVFNFHVWKTIGINGNSEQIIKVLQNTKPIYRDTLNGFVTFGLDTPITVQDTIYVGWVQSDERNLQIGFDRNDTHGIGNTFIMVNNVWSRPNISEKGSPMLRIILDGKRDYTGENAASIKPISPSENVQIYPNPCADIVNINANDIDIKEIYIYDLLGKLVLQEEFRTDTKLDLSSIRNGFYILHILKNGEVIEKEKLQISR